MPLFKIPIGDWSGDGHNECEWYIYQSNKTIEEIREAFFASRDKVPAELQPENICCDYLDHQVSSELFRRLCELYPDLAEDYDIMDMDEEPVEIDADDMVRITIGFIRLSLPDWDVQEVATTSMLPFCGFDGQQRHISHIGYGCF